MGAYYEKIINYICSFTYPYSLYSRSLDIYHRYLSYNLDANMSQITKHIYIGNLSAAYHQGFIKDNNIEYMITAIWDIPKINETLTSLNVNIIDVPKNNIKQHFLITNIFIEAVIIGVIVLIVYWGIGYYWKIVDFKKLIGLVLR